MNTVRTGMHCFNEMKWWKADEGVHFIVSLFSWPSQSVGEGFEQDFYHYAWWGQTTCFDNIKEKQGTKVREKTSAVFRNNTNQKCRNREGTRFEGFHAVEISSGTVGLSHHFPAFLYFLSSSSAFALKIRVCECVVHPVDSETQKGKAEGPGQ